MEGVKGGGVVPDPLFSKINCVDIVQNCQNIGI